MILAGCVSLPGIHTANKAAAPDKASQEFVRITKMMEQGNLRDAELELLQFAYDNPKFSGPYINLGIIYMKTDRPERAERAFELAIERNPQNPVAYNQLGILLRQEGRFSESEDAYRKATKADPLYALAYLNRGVLLDLYLQKPEQALLEYERYLQLVSEENEQVNKWIAEVRMRVRVNQKTVQVSP
jgi:Flp pilus assembly protein TadD